MKNYVKAKEIYLYDFLMLTVFTAYVVISNDFNVIIEGNPGEILDNYVVEGYIIDSIRSSESGDIYLEVHEE